MKFMVREIKFLLIMLLSMSGLFTRAQNSQVMYYMNLPQNHLLNPAIRPSNSFYLGLPGITGVNVNINNNFFNFSDIFSKSASGDSVISILHPDYDVSEFVAKIKDRNYIEPQALVQLFGLGFNAGQKLYIFLDINERVEGNFVLPGDLLRLGFEGNEQFVGNLMDLSSLRTDAKIYHEIGLGFSREFSDKLTIGIKGKYLMGIGSVSMDNKALEVLVEEDYTHTFNADLMMNISAPVTVHVNANNIDSVSFDDSRFDTDKGIIDYFLKSENTGFGFDLGAEYRFGDRFKISAAVTDFGSIKWKRDITNLKAESTFKFSGVDMLEVYNGTMTFDSLGQELLDSLKNSFYVTDTRTPFTTYLPYGVTFGACYNLSKSFSIGVLSYTRVMGKQFKEALTLSANVNFGNAFSTTFAYTAANGRYDNLGAGMAFRTGWFQFYFIADRLPVTWNKVISDGSTIPVPESWNTAHLRAGMNLVFGNRLKKKDDKPMLMLK